MQKKIIPFGVLFFLLFYSNIATAKGLPAESLAILGMEGKTYYLACNLHADPAYNKVSSVNYQVRGGLIPWGSEVTILRILRNRMVFQVMKTKKEYSYEFHWKTRKATQNLREHVNRIFVTDIQPVRGKVEAMSGVDRDGIYEGVVKPGMSREAMFIAIGYPPEFTEKNPYTARSLQYWRNRWSKFIVAFSRLGKVTEIIGNY